MATGRRGVNDHDVGASRGHRIMQGLNLPGIGRNARVDAHHGGLLLDFTASADHHERRRVGHANEERRCLGSNVCFEGVGLRVVEVCQRQIVPDHEAKLVAQREEGGRLIGTRTTYANHVVTAGSDELQPFPQLDRVYSKRRGIERKPGAAANKQRHTIEDESEPVAVGIAVDGDGTKPERSQRSSDELALRL